MTMEVRPGRRTARETHVLIIPATEDLRERRIEWDNEDRVSVEHARAIFEESQDAGMSAFRVEPSVPHVFGGYSGADASPFPRSGKGVFVTHFDERAERIVMIPPLKT